MRIKTSTSSFGTMKFEHALPNAHPQSQYHHVSENQLYSSMLHGHEGQPANGIGTMEDMPPMQLPLLGPNETVASNHHLNHRQQNSGSDIHRYEYSFDDHHKNSVDSRDQEESALIEQYENFESERKQGTVKRRHTVCSVVGGLEADSNDGSNFGCNSDRVDNEVSADKDDKGLLANVKRTMSAPCGIIPSQNNIKKEASKKPRPMSTIMANRRSAARSRARRLQYITDLENSVALLRDRILQLTEEVKAEKYNKHIVITENTALRCQLESLNAR